MRIAFIVNSYPPRLGGLESHIYHLSVSLAQLGHEVYVLTISDKPGHRQEEGVDIRTDRRHFPIADIISFPALGATRAIARFLREHRLDVVSVHTRFFPLHTKRESRSFTRSTVPVLSHPPRRSSPPHRVRSM